MDQVSVAADTTSGVTVKTKARRAGAAISRALNCQIEPAKATEPTTRKKNVGTPNECLAILSSQIVNCQTVGISVKTFKSKTVPPRIQIVLFGVTACPKCRGFLAIEDNGNVNCQTIGCELNGVIYMPDVLAEGGNLNG